MVLVGALVLAALLATPWLVERAFTRYVSAGPDRAASAGEVRFDPLTLTLELEDLVLRDGLAGFGVAIPSATLDFDWRGFIGWGPRSFERIAIERPSLEGRSWPQLSGLALALLRGPIAGLRVGTLSVAAGNVALTGGDAALTEGDARGLADISVTATDLDAGPPADDAPPGRIEVRASTAGGAAIELEGAVPRGLAGSGGRIRVHRHELAAIPSWLAAARLTELEASLELEGDYAFVAAAADGPRWEITGARVEVGAPRMTTATGFGVSADALTGDGSLVVTAVDGKTETRAHLELDDARFDITDGGAPAPKVYAVQDAAVVMSLSSADMLALDIDGRLGEAGDVSLMLRALGPITSVALEVDDVPAAWVSPYMAAATEHELAAGMYDLALSFERDAGRVSGDLRVAAQNMALAYDALPPGPATTALELAMALLENTDGSVELTVPFMDGASSVRSLVTAALETRLAAVTAAPFETLAAVTANDVDALRTVRFAPGGTELDERARSTVDLLATALAQRPKLGVRVRAAVDPEADRLTLARGQIEMHVTLATAAAGPQVRPEPVDFASARAQDILEEFAGERLPPERVASIARSYGCDRSTAGSCSPAYYAALFDALAANEPIPAATLTRLARFRAQAVADALEERGIAAGRVSVAGTVQTDEDAAGGIGLRLELFPRPASGNAR